MNINDLVVLFLFNSLWIFGLYELFAAEFIDESHPDLGIDNDSKGLFWKVKQWSVINIGWFYSKPICLCPPCMASLHSLYFYWTAMLVTGNINHYSLLIYFAYAICLVGFNHIVVKILNR